MNMNSSGLVQSSQSRLPIFAGETANLSPDYGFPAAETQGFDLRRIWSAIWRNRTLTAAIFALSLGLGVLSLFLSDQIYRATASVEIDNQPIKVLGTEEFQQVSGPQETDRLLQTHIDILRSYSLAERVVDDLNLASDPRFLGSANIKPESANKREKVIKSVRDGLVVSLPRNSRVVPVSFDSSDPQIAARISNHYVDNLISGNLQRHFDTSRYSKEFLQQQLELTKARLEQSERALLGYARSVGIVDPNAGPGDPGTGSSRSEAPRSLTSANLVDLNQSFASAQAARIQAEGKWREAQSTPTMNLPEVLSNPAIQQLTQRRAELQAQRQRELQHRMPDHPEVQQAAAAINELDQQIAGLAGSIRRSILNQYNIAQKQEAQFSSTVGRLKGATLAEQQLGIRYNILKREVDTNRELYNGLLQRYKEISAQAGVTNNNIAVVDRAQTPLLPILPRPLVNLTLAALLGLLLAIAAVWILEVFHDGVRTPDEVEQRFGLPLLGHTPRLAPGATAQQLLDPSSEMSEAYQSVRASVEMSTQAGNPKTLLITSSRASEGKTTTALAIARNTAASGRTVLLIDADMRRPALHTQLSMAREPGLSNFLTQQLLVEGVIYKTDTPNLSFMPAGPKPPSPSELVSGDAMRALLSYLGGQFDQIIIDSPPVLGLADAPRLASVVDGTMLVIEANRSHRGAIDNALRRLHAAGAQMIGAVLVKFDPAKADIGYAYLNDYYDYGPREEASKAKRLTARTPA